MLIKGKPSEFEVKEVGALIQPRSWELGKNDGR